ncbi:unnamed protein product [Lactuca saligna]|uniref:Uncharacterized protein n=1 Tax=Lactuca saligna TaxID=75948 RepID=A0AA36ELH8_LACSI|nr:unnamed protein product [Lactuca saligna]
MDSFKQVRGDFLRTEEYCCRAILVNPSGGNALSLKCHRFQVHRRRHGEIRDSSIGAFSCLPVNVLQLARLCDAPDLHLKCVNPVSNGFKAVEKTEGWKFLQTNDPFLELEILQVIDESESVIQWMILVRFQLYWNGITNFNYVGMES